MLDLIINSKGITAESLRTRLEASGHQVHTLELPSQCDDLRTIKAHFEQLAETGECYNNIYLNVTDSFSEMDDFNQDPKTAIHLVQGRLKEILKTLKYGSQHLARAEGGRIFVLCYDHSMNINIDVASNPITNNAITAAVQSLAKEVARFGVAINLFLIHPPKESLPPKLWRDAKHDLKVYSMKYKPVLAEAQSEIMQMYSEVSNLATSGGVIPVGTGIAVCNI